MRSLYFDKLMTNLPLTTIGFDADDTLWQNEHFYRLTEARFAALLARLRRGGAAARRLLEAEKRTSALRLRHQGLHAVDDRDGHRGDRGPASPRPSSPRSSTPAASMLSHPVETLPHAPEVRWPAGSAGGAGAGRAGRRPAWAPAGPGQRDGSATGTGDSERRAGGPGGGLEQGDLADGAGHQAAVAGDGGGALVGPPLHGVVNRAGHREQQRVGRGARGAPRVVNR